MDEHLLERSRWLIRLRWLAIAGLAAAPFTAEIIFGIHINKLPVLLLDAFVLIYNAAFCRYIIILGRNPLRIKENTLRKIANIQISLDLIVLTLVLHFTGGIENPFIFYFIFHIVISSIMLHRIDAFLQATLASLLILALTYLEFFGIIPHYPLGNMVTERLYIIPTYVTGLSVVFISTIYISAYMVSSISQRLIAANEQLKQKDKIKSEYVLRVSHDIKGHLAAVQSTIHPVVSGMTGPLNEKQKDLLSRSEERTNKLLVFVKSLLNLTIAKLKDGKETESFDFNQVVRISLDLVMPDAAESGVNIFTDLDESPVTCDGSKAEIQATLLEIMSNAVKYTPENGKVFIKTMKKSYSVLTEISDTGIGIEKNEIPQVFNEFYRSSKAETKDGSSGLGLAMAKHVVEKHGGKIWVESETGKGTTFYIELPAT